MNYLFYDELKEYVKVFKFKKRQDFFDYVRNNSDEKIPKRPDLFYKNEWESWGLFLGNNNVSKRSIIYENIDTIIYLIKENNITTRKKWIEFYNKNKTIYKLPVNLSKSFKKRYSFFFCNLPSNKLNKYYLSFENAKYLCEYYKIKSIKEYNYLSKLYKKLPNNFKYYKKELWIKNKILTYDDCKLFLKKLNIKNIYDWISFLNNKPKFIPRHPDIYYGNLWENWQLFLDYKISKISIGESYIKEYLERKDILYIREKSFDDCIYIKKLKFDFYLPLLNMIIEFDGKQHFEPIALFGGDEFLKKSTIRDKIKNDYCLNKNIKMIRIDYLNINEVSNILDKNLVIQ